MDEGIGEVWLAGVADAGEVATLLHDFNTEFGVPTPGAAALAQRLGGLLSSPAVFAVLAGRPAVAVALVTTRPNVWFEGLVATLDELYVVPRLRGRGIGTAVMERVVDVAVASGVDAIEINVDEGDVDAQRFYERHGFSSFEPDTQERTFYFFRELTR
jgi:GNAT superfamily N-acetyltransferase